MKTPIAEAIRTNALKHGINPQLIAAIIHVESAGNPAVVRYEPAFFQKYLALKNKKQLNGHIPTLVSFETEKKLRAFSFGLMQIMGNTAREAGFKHELLTELIDSATNIEFGCQIFKKCLDSATDIDHALLNYNGGGNEAYPGKVKQVLADGSAQYLFNR